MTVINNQNLIEPCLLENLKEKINSNEIVPIIGINAYEVIDKDGEPLSISVTEFIVRNLLQFYQQSLSISDENIHECCNYTNHPLKTMTRLYYLLKTKDSDIGVKMHEFLRPKNEFVSQIRLKKQVATFLRNNHFKLIVSTTFLPLFNNSNYTTCYYKRQSSNQDITLISGNLQNDIIYYLLGKDDYNGSYYENAFLEYLHCLHDATTRPQNLLDYLSERYLMMIGCEIPDWTFRFLLYSLNKGSVMAPKKDKETFQGAFIQHNFDGDMPEFLSRINYLMNDSVNMEKYLSYINNNLNKPSLFLSYSANPTTDYVQYKAIEDLYNKLNQMFEVWWFPTHDGAYKPGGQYWREIEEGIKKCNFFMPVITNSLYNKLKDIPEGNNTTDIDFLKDIENGFITEWKLAKEEFLNRQEKNRNTIYSLPCLIDVNFEKIKDQINTKVFSVRELFLPEFGCNCVNYGNLDVEQIFKQLTND